MGAPVELRLDASSDRFDVTDDRWLNQVAGLVGELQADVGDVSRAREPAQGSKGSLDAILLSLSSAGALTAAVELIKAWLQRDRSRSIKVSWSEEGKLQSLELAGSRIDSAAFDQVVQAVTQQLPASP